MPGFPDPTPLCLREIWCMKVILLMILSPWSWPGLNCMLAIVPHLPCWPEVLNIGSVLRWGEHVRQKQDEGLFILQVQSTSFLTWRSSRREGSLGAELWSIPIQGTGHSLGRPGPSHTLMQSQVHGCTGVNLIQSHPSTPLRRGRW